MSSGRIIGIVISLQKIGFVGVVDARIFGANVNPLYMWICFLGEGYCFKAEVVKVTFTAEQKGVHILIDNQVFYCFANMIFQLLSFWCICMTEKATSLGIHKTS